MKNRKLLSHSLKPIKIIFNYGLQNGHFHKSILVHKIEPRKTTLKAVTSCLLDFLCPSCSVDRMNRGYIVNVATQKQEFLEPDL